MRPSCERTDRSVARGSLACTRKINKSVALGVFGGCLHTDLVTQMSQERDSLGQVTRVTICRQSNEQLAALGLNWFHGLQSMIAQL